MTVTLTNSRSTDDDLLQRMESVRQRLDADVDCMRTSVGKLMDWRAMVRKHPLVTAAAAGTIGYVLVPNRRFEQVVDVETLEKLSGNQRMVVAPKAAVTEQASLTNQLVAILGAGLVRAAGMYLASRLNGMSAQPARKDS